jgi:hypothetical protein
LRAGMGVQEPVRRPIVRQRANHNFAEPASRTLLNALKAAYRSFKSTLRVTDAGAGPLGGGRRMSARGADAAGVVINRSASAGADGGEAQCSRCRLTLLPSCRCRRCGQRGPGVVASGSAAGVIAGPGPRAQGARDAGASARGSGSVLSMRARTPLACCDLATARRPPQGTLRSKPLWGTPAVGARRSTSRWAPHPTPKRDFSQCNLQPSIP